MTEQSHGALPSPSAVASQERRRRRRRPLLIGVAAVLALAVLVAGGELFARHQLRSSVSDAMADGLHTSSVDVGIGSSPALLDVSRGRIDQVSLAAQRATVCEVHDVSLQADVRDVSTSPSGGRIGDSNLTLTLSRRALNDLLATSTSAKNVTATLDPATDSVRLVGLGGLARVQARPKLTGGKLGFTVVSASFAGRRVPPAQVQRLLGADSGTGTGTGFARMPLGLRATAAKVTGSGLETRFHGQPTTLPRGKQPLKCTGR